MKYRRGAYQPRTIDRVMFSVLAALHVSNGIYLIGPWYLNEWDNIGKAPLTNVFNNPDAVKIYGILLLINGAALLYAAASEGRRSAYTYIVEYSLLIGFLLRLYAFIGVAIALVSWRPPSYLSHLATVVMLGAYWVWVRVNVRTTQ